MFFFFFFQAEDGIRDRDVTGVQTCALPICILVIAPDACDFTCTVRIGWIVPAAEAVTMMSRRCTGTISYMGAATSLWQAATVRAAVAARRYRFTASLPFVRRARFC